MGPKPTSKSSRVSKPEASKPSVRSKSDNKPECKLENRSENTETKKLHKDDCEDTSVLHSSIDLSVSGLRQVSKIFEKGTAEVQNLLSFECDVIYECKVCRNLFRSVANFISHKRIYCTTQYQTSNQLLHLNNKLEEQCNSLDPADAVHPNVAKTKLKNPNRIVPRSNLAAVLNSCVSFSKPIHIRSNRNEFNANEDPSLLLQSMQDSKAGVFQTFVPNLSSGYSMLMKDQVQELYSAQPETEIIDSDLWGVNGDENSSEFTNGVSDVESCKTYTCDHCGLPCSSAKTLLRHKKLIHEIARTCYLCPCCKSTFPTTWSVHRHLFKVHHKTNEQVRKLRLQIKSKVLRPGEMTKGLNDKMKIAQQKITDQQKWDLENEEWLDQLGKDIDLLRCGSCGRKFERRAALKAHYQICQKRIASVTSTIQYRGLQEKESCSEAKQKSMRDSLKLLPVVALTALTPAQIKENLSGKSHGPEKKIGIQVRMDYCKTMSSSTNSHLMDTVTERSNRLSGFGKANPRDMTSVDDDRRTITAKSCLETLLTEKINNRSDSGNDSESQDDISVALDFSSDSVIDEDAIKLNMYDILGINSTDSYADNALISSLKMEPSNRDEFTNGNSLLPNKRKKAYPVKRLVCNLENNLKTDFKNRSKVWSDKSNDLDCVFRKENAKVTYTNCKVKNNKTELDRVNHFRDPFDSFCPELAEKLANYYNKNNGTCLVCNNNFDPVNILRHITEHGNWLKFCCKWPQCEYKSFTKTELIKHILKEHQSLKEEIAAHDFVELISKKDWKFIVAVSGNKYRKKPNLLVESLNKLKERLNSLGKLSTPVISQETSASNDSNDASKKSVEKSGTNVLDKENSFDEVNMELGDIKVTESMDVDNASSSEIELVDLCSSIDGDDCQVSSVKSCSQNDQSDSENSNHSESSNCDNNDVSQVGNVNIVKEVACDGNKRMSESNLEVITGPNEKESSVKVSKDSKEEKASIEVSMDLNEEQTSPEESIVSVEEKTSASPTNSMSYYSHATDDEDDLMEDSHSVHTLDADPSCSVLDKSEMDIELDDDHLRAVMMEMIFGQTSDETVVNPANEFVAKNVDDSKKCKLDAELNV